MQPSPARAEPHDAAAWLPVPVPDSLPTVDELIVGDPSVVTDPAVVGDPGLDVGIPGPGRAEPHDSTAWLPLPDSDGLPSIDELLNPDQDQDGVPVARDINAVPSPARAEPHDALAWLPLPESSDLPGIDELLEPGRTTAPSRRPSTPARRAERRHLAGRMFAIALVAATLAGLFYGATVLLDKGADVALRVDGRLISTETGVSTVGSLLREQGVKLGEFDRVAPAASTAIADGMSVRVVRAFPVAVDFDGSPTTVYTTHRAPPAFLGDASEQLAASGDLALRDAPKKITKDATLVVRTKKVGTLLVDGSAVNYDTPALTVAELLASNKVVLGPQDFTQPFAVDQVLPNNESVTVVRVATETETVDEPYTLPDERRPDDTMKVGETREQAAVAGTQKVTYSVVRHDGSEVDRTPISKVPVVEAKPYILFYGTQHDPRWDKIAECETGKNWRAQGPTYQGGLGIFAQTWKGFGGYEFAQNAGDATKEEQIIVAERIRARYGFRAWGCGKKLGYP